MEPKPTSGTTLVSTNIKWTIDIFIHRTMNLNLSQPMGRHSITQIQSSNMKHHPIKTFTVIETQSNNCPSKQGFCIDKCSQHYQTDFCINISNTKPSNIHYTVSQKFRTLVMFSNNSNKSGQILITFGRENHRWIISLQVHSWFLRFDKTGYQLRLFLQQPIIIRM